MQNFQRNSSNDPFGPPRDGESEEDTLIRFMPMIKRITGQTARGTREDRQDLLSEALLGMLLAIRRYKKENGRFAAYAQKYIHGMILK